MKVVINTCYGGFGLSDEAYQKLIEYGVPVRAYNSLTSHDENVIYDNSLTEPNTSYTPVNRYWDTRLRLNRAHPLLIRVVEELGERANGQCARLRIIDIPDDVKFEIDEYDGMESVSEVHRQWS